MTLRHGASLQFECDPGLFNILIPLDFTRLLIICLSFLGYMLAGNRGTTCFSGLWRPDQLPVCKEGVVLFLFVYLESMSIILDRHVSLQHTLHKFVSKG